ncbi:hypothetical protein [Paenirhodobacter populi]|uniref:Uncharacterized protein n=1 Tax=Paenirhodobacter populi TaxID=2306993 RepID=A0A443IJB3_9RHOB|nr:hypothetical protein [Sinirhodobacter populi]RWR04391.1 hypothetical protein D2T33_21140 [Sinirhodobacter populi]
MKDIFPAIRDLWSGLVVGFHDKAAQWEARREAKAWVKALPEGFLTDLVAKVPLPEGMWNTATDSVGRDTYDETVAIYRAYIDTALAEKAMDRRAALAYAMMLVRNEEYRGNPDVRARRQDRINARMAEQAARDEAHRARLAAMPPNPNSLAGMKAQAEKNALAGVGYRLANGRELTSGERFRLGLPPGGPRKPAPGSLLDGQGLNS